jgi:hypothetical protein
MLQELHAKQMPALFWLKVALPTAMLPHFC